MDATQLGARRPWCTSGSQTGLWRPFTAQSPHCRRRQGASLRQPRVGALKDGSAEVVQTAEYIGRNVTEEAERATALAKRLEKKTARARHRLVYTVAAITASTGVTALAVWAVHSRFAWHMQDGSDFPTLDALGCLLLVFGGVVGMEMWARWAHQALWHDFLPGWALHKSHHEPRRGPFEKNDVFAIVNAVPAMGLCAYGFLTPTMLGGLCFGAGLGVTLFGIMYMTVHDGLVHNRFPVGPIADVPYLQRVAVAHRMHHAAKYKGVPWGLFLGPQELAAVGATAELDALCADAELKRRKLAKK